VNTGTVQEVRCFLIVAVVKEGKDESVVPNKIRCVFLWSQDGRSSHLKNSYLLIVAPCKASY
jgi:hypothetical protein